MPLSIFIHLHLTLFCISRLFSFSSARNDLLFITKQKQLNLISIDHLRIRDDATNISEDFCNTFIPLARYFSYVANNPSVCVYYLHAVLIHAGRKYVFPHSLRSLLQFIAIVKKKRHVSRVSKILSLKFLTPVFSRCKCIPSS